MPAGGMKRYGNLSGNSGVVAYALRPGAIVVAFRDGENYEYTQDEAGPEAIAAMQALAVAGRGLSAFIARQRPPCRQL